MRVLIVLAAAAALAQNPPADQQRLSQIQQKRARGEQITQEELAFAKRMMAQRRAEYLRAHPPRESTGLVPLPDLGKALYQGYPGGLYGDGRNQPPHLKAGLQRARQIAPVDGKIALLSIGMSNTTMEFQAFQKLAAAAGGINPHLVLVDGAQGGQTARITADPNSNFWKVVDQRLGSAGVRAAQVQVVWLKQANAQPSEPFPAEAKALQRDIARTLNNLAARFPNLKIAYLSSRIYGGFAETPLNPEPHAYETGFAVKWAIADQVAGAPELNYDPAKGAVRAPWVAWGPYLWTDGTKGRKDGLVFTRADLAEDGTHPSPAGREKVARLLLEFFQTDPTAKPWFLAR